MTFQLSTYLDELSAVLFRDWYLHITATFFNFQVCCLCKSNNSVFACPSFQCVQMDKRYCDQCYNDHACMRKLNASVSIECFATFYVLCHLICKSNSRWSLGVNSCLCEICPLVTQLWICWWWQFYEKEYWKA